MSLEVVDRYGERRDVRLVEGGVDLNGLVLNDDEMRAVVRWYACGGEHGPPRMPVVATALTPYGRKALGFEP